MSRASHGRGARPARTSDFQFGLDAQRRVKVSEIDAGFSSSTPLHLRAVPASTRYDGSQANPSGRADQAAKHSTDDNFVAFDRDNRACRKRPVMNLSITGCLRDQLGAFSFIVCARTATRCASRSRPLDGT